MVLYQQQPSDEPAAMLMISAAMDRTRRRGQHGLTLIEILVSMSILAVIAGVIAAAFSITFKALAPGATKDRLNTATDLSVLEQILGRDGARATCITAPDLSTQTYQVYGGTPATATAPANNGTCNAATGFGGYAGRVPALAACTGAPYATLCLGWPQIGTAANGYADVDNSTCHVAVYTSSTPRSPATPPPAGSVVITRTEYTVPISGSASITATLVDHFDTVKSPWVNGVTASTFTSYRWVRTLQATIIGTGVKTNQPQQTMIVRPVAVDPSGSASAITSIGSPC